MKLLKEERGSALLIVLFMILIFTLLGLTVLSASIGGATRTQTKQKDVQSLHLAEKALNEAVARIKATLDGREDINPDAIDAELRSMFPGIEANTVKTEFSSAPTTEAELIDENDVHQIEITVTANIDGTERKLKQIVGINAFPDVLNYAAGSEGNLILNGSPYFLGGDLYAGKKLQIKNQAEYIYNSENGAISTANVGKYSYLEGRAFVQSLDDFIFCNATLTPNCSPDQFVSINSTSDKGTTTIPTVLGVQKGNVELKTQEDFVQLNMDESFIDKVTEAVGGNGTERAIIKNNYFSTDVMAFKNYLKSRTDKLKPAVFEDLTDPDYEVKKTKDIESINDNAGLSGGSYLYNGNFNIGNGWDFKQLVFTKDSKGQRDPIVPKSTYFTSNWFIIDGDLNIDNTPTDNIARDPIKIRGNILVTGDVNIKGDVTMDATMFVLGSTNILDASITGLEEVGQINKELVLLSKGEILISRINSFKDLPSAGYKRDVAKNENITRLDAFFYTDSNAELYGVGSVFWIRGGFFAKDDLVINAVRGNTKETGDLSSLLIAPGQDNLGNPFSRFIIEYNKDIFNHQQSALPRVKGINLSRSKKVLVK
ncbi:hypothetical protein GQF01_35045 [Paenibacillus sp. 5J-6]|uniref:Type 4 fimbrial biogenesis protein PilX N-terminal domain-containing protein n=1 Tax=Paenibacillus silvestris TaxID=2606219 RepID=A0A6L8VAL3_9BACL|nr:hypothetical protein [Paenibacillus silvestris]MZQ87348.1 hypothetical protein [Paenibacillus silvestris]